MPPGVPDWLWIQNVVFPLIGMGMGVLFLVGGYRLVSRLIDRRHELRLAERSGGAGSEAFERLQARVDLLEDQAGRVAELEERVDFAERLLAQGRSSGDLHE
jgi:hypothetical protein